MSGHQRRPSMAENLTPEQIKELKEVFNVFLRAAFAVFDRDGSGTISAEELRNVMKSIGENLSDAEIDEMIKEADANGDGNIDYDEFAKIMSA
ncbi:unnamed protein product [Aureobasidium pullulans]|nr:unnamed protein product [Aureobasidium pullulans]CAD0038160.1 unnamed protein product [Aureobasidium pullulans]CAD0039952.1 unnamed protein product [Aureobasidium pullulans]